MSNFSFCFVLLLFVVFVKSIDIPSEEDQIRYQFNEFILRYNKPYGDDPIEYQNRLAVFKQTLDRIKILGKKDRQAKYGINEFSDLTREEFKSRRLSPIHYNGEALATACLASGVTSPHLSTENIPDSFDWRNKSVVTEVKNQGDCGSCWAFSTIAVIESQWAIKGNALTEFSEQLLVDCSHGCCLEEGEDVCNSGCEGGWQWNAYIDVMLWKGVETEEQYPYTGETGQCQRTNGSLMAPITNYTCLSSPNGNPADEAQMAAYLVANGPIAIAMNAELLQDYTSGILDPWFSWECEGTSLDHAITIVGYGQEHSDVFGTTLFWIVKNSWGNTWGENGYFRVARGYGVCGLNNAVSAVVM